MKTKRNEKIWRTKHRNKPLYDNNDITMQECENKMASAKNDHYGISQKRVM